MATPSTASAVSRRLLCANARLIRAINDTLERDGGLSLGWFLALDALASAPDCYMKMSELAECVALTTSGTTRIVDRIEEAGYVERRSCPADRRVSYAALTDAGRDARDLAAPHFRRAVDAYFGERLDEVDLATLDGLIERLHQ